MSTAANRRVGARLVLAASALVLGPALLAGPAYAATSTPTPIASEPPGGATCLPGTSATCGQDVAPSPTAVASSASPTPSATPSATSSGVTSLPVTGGTRPHLARTGGGAATGWGYAGTALLLGGSALVLAARRPRGASR